MALITKPKDKSTKPRRIIGRPQPVKAVEPEETEKKPTKKKKHGI